MPGQAGTSAPAMALMELTQTVGQDTVEFAVLDAPAPIVDRPGVVPFRPSLAALVDLFGTDDAGTPWWHRSRARELRRQAQAEPVAAVSGAYVRLAARHIATAQLLEDSGEHWADTA